LRRSLPRLAQPTSWRVPRCWRRSRIWPSAQATRFKSAAGGLIHDHEGDRTAARVGVAARGHVLHGLQSSPILRHRGVVLSGVVDLHLCRLAALGGSPLDIFAPAYCDRAAGVDISESDCAIHLHALAYLVSIGGENNDARRQ